MSQSPANKDVPTTPVSLLKRLRYPGDDAAWTRFVYLYTPLLDSWSRRAGLQDADAADLVQDVFVRLARELPRFQYDPAQRFRSWLRNVTLNLFRDRLKRGQAPAPAGTLQAIPAADEIEKLIDGEYTDWLVRRALQLMQTDFQPAAWQACWQMVVEERSAEEVARALHMTVGAVYAAKFRVLARLRQELDGLLD
jgi:RNA polymerase sigma-70 factor (ECF subfamily)